jgi:hypothetical protein
MASRAERFLTGWVFRGMGGSASVMWGWESAPTRPSPGQQLPLPARDMFPLSVEERLICYADKFFSKTDNGRHEKTIDEITAGLARYEANAMRTVS